jgi:PAS domain S-box-containing protein
MTPCDHLNFENYQIFNSIQDYLAIIDTDFNVVNINAAYLRLLIQDKKDIIGRKCYDTLKGSLCHSQKCPLKRIKRIQKVVEFETEKLLENGTRLPLILTATPFLSADCKLIGMIQSFKDIKELKLSNKKLSRLVDGTIKALSAVVEARDTYTSGHQEKVTGISVAIAKQMGFQEDRIKSIWMAATIHDIGKIYVPSEFLSKPGKLTDIEYAVIKTHPSVGYSILKNIAFEWPIAEIVHQHHERLDGSGYPLGLSGENILLEAKIVAVADVFEAMSSHRPYRPAIGMGKAIEEISRNRGTLFDPEVVDAFFKIQGIRIDQTAITL